MDPRVLIHLAAPLALTLILTIAEILGWPLAVRLGTLAAMTLAWLAFAWSAYRPAAANALSREQTRLLDELRSFVGSEVNGSRQEIERTRELIRESVAKLGTSFDAVNRKSRQQGEVVARIIDRTGDDGGGVDVQQFALQASQKMEQLVEALEAVAGQSGTTVTHIDAMAEHLDGIFALLEDVKSIADQTNLLALNAAIEAARAGEAGPWLRGGRRRGAQPLGALDRLQRTDPQAGAFSSKESIAKVRDTVTTHGLARPGPFTRCPRRSRRHARARGRHQPRALGNGMREIAECGRAIDGSVAEAVRSLQFEDIATQALGAANLHLERLSAINRKRPPCRTCCTARHHDSEVKQALGKLVQRIGQMRSEWERPPHKPVMQQSMDAGSVELF